MDLVFSHLQAVMVTRVEPDIMSTPSIGFDVDGGGRVVDVHWQNMGKCS